MSKFVSKRTDDSDQKVSQASGRADLPGSHGRNHTLSPAELAQRIECSNSTDRELLALASEVIASGESVRNLVLFGQRHEGLQVANIATAKRAERKRMLRMLLGWFGLREESLATPYRDARMLLTGWVLFYGGALAQHRNGRGVSMPSHGSTEVLRYAGAEHVTRMVGALYPDLATEMRRSERTGLIRAAITSVGASEKRVPWIAITEVWRGIGKGEPNPERWRKDWHEHQHRMNRP